MKNLIHLFANQFLNVFYLIFALGTFLTRVFFLPENEKLFKFVSNKSVAVAGCRCFNIETPVSGEKNQVRPEVGS